MQEEKHKFSVPMDTYFSKLIAELKVFEENGLVKNITAERNKEDPTRIDISYAVTTALNYITTRICLMTAEFEDLLKKLKTSYYPHLKIESTGSLLTINEITFSIMDANELIKVTSHCLQQQFSIDKKTGKIENTNYFKKEFIEGKLICENIRSILIPNSIKFIEEL